MEAAVAAVGEGAPQTDGVFEVVCAGGCSIRVAMRFLMMWMVCLLAVATAVRGEMKDLEGEWVLDTSDVKLLEKRVMELVEFSLKQRKVKMDVKQRAEMADSLIDYLGEVTLGFHQEDDGKWYYSIHEENGWNEYVINIKNDGEIVSLVTNEGTPTEVRHGFIHVFWQKNALLTGICFISGTTIELRGLQSEVNIAQIDIHTIQKVWRLQGVLSSKERNYEYAWLNNRVTELEETLRKILEKK